MPITSKYLFVASMDVDADKEALFNEVYDTEHIPNLLKVPGVRAVTRMQGEPFAVSIGGAEQQVAHEGPRYSALYEIDGPHVLVSPEWAQAVEILKAEPGPILPYSELTPLTVKALQINAERCKAAVQTSSSVFCFVPSLEMALRMMMAFTYLPGFVTASARPAHHGRGRHRLIFRWLVLIQAVHPGRHTLEEMARWTPATITACALDACSKPRTGTCISS